MSSPGNKPDPDPMKFFEGAHRPTPKTREEARQLAVDIRHDELDRIAEPAQDGTLANRPISINNVGFMSM